MISDTGKHLEALSTEEHDYFKIITKAFRRGTPLKKDIPSDASPDLQELLTKFNGMLLPRPKVFVNIYEIMIHRDPITTIQEAKRVFELYKKVGLPHGELQAIFSASKRKVNGFTEVFCGKPVYEGNRKEDYCPVHRTSGNIFSEKCKGCTHNYQRAYDDWVVC